MHIKRAKYTLCTCSLCVRPLEVLTFKNYHPQYLTSNILTICVRPSSPVNSVNDSGGIFVFSQSRMGLSVPSHTRLFNWRLNPSDHCVVHLPERKIGEEWAGISEIQRTTTSTHLKSILITLVKL